MIKESVFIKEIKDQFPLRDPHILGIGDDAARIGNSDLICTDVMVDGSHFIRKEANLKDIAYKSMMINISDLCAMGGYPRYALLTLGLPDDTDRKELNGLIDGWREAVDGYDFDIIGGDTVGSRLMFISVTMIGTPFKDVLLRSTAREGDYIYISGTLGDSALGLDLIQHRSKVRPASPEYFVDRHYRPTARLRLMRYLSHHCDVHACIDISDGLGDDLLKLVRSSGKGFFLEWNELPLSVDEIGTALGEQPQYFYDLALNGGEDYELLFTSPHELDVLHILKQTGTRVTPVGRIVEEGYQLVFNEQKKDIEESIRKYQHFRD